MKCEREHDQESEAADGSPTAVGRLLGVSEYLAIFALTGY